MAGALGPMASENTANAVNQSIAQAGGALGQISTQIFNIAQKRQERIDDIAEKRQQHINKGILANEEVIYEKTQQQIMLSLEQNRSNPEKVLDISSETWRQFYIDLEKRATDQNYPRELTDTLKSRSSVNIERLNTNLMGKVHGMQVQQSNDRLMSRAEQHLSNDDLLAAKNEIEKMDDFQDKKREKMQGVFQRWIVNTANLQFNDVSQQSTSSQINLLNQMLKSYTEKDKNGEYVYNQYKDQNGEVLRYEDGEPIGFVPMEVRNQIATKAMSLLSQAKNQEMANIKPILEVFEENGSKLGNQALQQSILAGNITQETADSYASIFSSEAARGEENRVKEGLPKLVTQEAKYQSLSNKGQDLTTEEITDNVKNQAISEEQGKRLMGRVVSTATAELNPANPLLDSQRNVYLGTDPRTYLQSYIKKNKDLNVEGKVEDKVTLLQAINDFPLGAEAKRRITREALEFFTIDFRESYKSTAPSGKAGVFDFLVGSKHRSTKREISPSEADVRSLVYRNMRNIGDLGQPFTIFYLIQAERQITSHFENKANGIQQHIALQKELEYALGNVVGRGIVIELLFD